MAILLKLSHTCAKFPHYAQLVSSTAATLEAMECNSTCLQYVAIKSLLFSYDD